MSLLSVSEAFAVLKEHGIASGKQELRRWLNAGYIQADKPLNRRFGWRITEEALDTFITRVQSGELGDLRRRGSLGVGLEGSLIRSYRRSLLAGDDGASSSAATIGPYVLQLEQEVMLLRSQMRALRQEVNDLKKVLGYPVLVPVDEE